MCINCDAMVIACLFTFTSLIEERCATYPSSIQKKTFENLQQVNARNPEDVTSGRMWWEAVWSSMKLRTSCTSLLLTNSASLEKDYFFLQWPQGQSQVWRFNGHCAGNVTWNIWDWRCQSILKIALMLTCCIIVQIELEDFQSDSNCFPHPLLAIVGAIQDIQSWPSLFLLSIIAKYNGTLQWHPAMAPRPLSSSWLKTSFQNNWTGWRGAIAVPLRGADLCFISSFGNLATRIFPG